MKQQLSKSMDANNIDLSKENLVLFTDAPKLLPKQPNGKYVHLSALYRWKNQGICGVRLETIFIAGSRYTSSEALNRFWHRVTAKKDKITPKQVVERRTSDADSELEKAGW